MRICQRPRWASLFEGFAAPFIHVAPDGYGELAASAGLTLMKLTVTDRNGITARATLLRSGVRSAAPRGPTGYRSRTDAGSSMRSWQPTSPSPVEPGCFGSPRCGPRSTLEP